MGYSTSFDGVIKFDGPLEGDALTEVEALIENGLGRPIGFAGLCDWELSSDKSGIMWNGAEKSYDMDTYAEAIVDLVAGYGVTCNGTVEASGEDPGDLWRIVVTNNVVKVERGYVAYH